MNKMRLSDLKQLVKQSAKLSVKKRQRGLTLVELMVVIVILGLLATIVVINVIPAGDQAAAQKARTDISIIDQALAQYRLDNFSYPSTDQGLEALVRAPQNLANSGKYRPGGYIKKTPVDPWNNPYIYISPSPTGEYEIYSLGADGREGGEGINADIRN